jgi:iron complex transport system substrate-binding protein
LRAPPPALRVLSVLSPGKWTVFLRPRFLLAFAFALVACSDAREQPAASIVLQDEGDREVRLDRPAQRIVSLVPAATDLIVALGGANRLVARTEYDTDSALAHLPSVGGGLTPNLEWIAARKPDLVIAWPDHSSRSVVTRLSELGIPVYGARAETLADARRVTSAIGMMLGRERAADSLNSLVTSTLDQVRARVAGEPPARVLYVIGIDPPMAAGGGNFVDELITLAGGNNVFSDVQGWPQVSLEEAVRRNPQLVIVAQGESRGDAEVRLRELPGWREIAAVRAGHVVGVDANHFNRWGPDLALAARILAEAFHPARFAEQTQP